MSYITCKSSALFFILNLTFGVSSAAAQNAPTAHSDDLMTEALTRVPQVALNQTAAFTARTVLANAPSLSVMRWQSQEDWGSDETELTLQLSFLSPAQRQLLATSNELSTALQQLQQQQQALQVSGVLRQLYWQAQLLKTDYEYYQSIAAHLQQLSEITEHQVDAGELSRYALLVVQQRYQQQQSLAQAKQAEQQQLLTLWQQLTGQSQWPHQLPETRTVTTQPHPQLQALQLQWQASLLASQQTAASDSAWSVSAGYKHIQSPTGSEAQVGLGFSIPLATTNYLSNVELQALQQQQRALTAALQQSQRELAQAQAEAQRNLTHWQQQLTAQRQAAALSSAAMAALEQLRQAQHIDTALYIDRWIEQLTYQYEARTIELQVQYAYAQLQQAQGVSL
ncbi:hypothetical protein CWI80_08265 [Pseudidiomarina sediminum]|uniref:TolC family protein n=1 Tax=Pseudidiomarina sediminum TaxID=431675 RepID=A0A432Z3T8_9GAMM|nr:TolC family protein [Pseudidiomarina sediminum]RUO72535.1 hypothetical protein CWI80_08265 [Pseudidiomarina sediminum]